jgi:hypothetical protein
VNIFGSVGDHLFGYETIKVLSNVEFCPGDMTATDLAMAQDVLGVLASDFGLWSVRAGWLVAAVHLVPPDSKGEIRVHRPSRMSLR